MVGVAQKINPRHSGKRARCPRLGGPGAPTGGRRRRAGKGSTRTRRGRDHLEEDGVAVRVHDHEAVAQAAGLCPDHVALEFTMAAVDSWALPGNPGVIVRR